MYVLFLYFSNVFEELGRLLSNRNRYLICKFILCQVFLFYYHLDMSDVSNNL